jgi:hypothetical protein
MMYRVILKLKDGSVKEITVVSTLKTWLATTNYDIEMMIAKRIYV